MIATMICPKCNGSSEEINPIARRCTPDGVLAKPDDPSIVADNDVPANRRYDNAGQVYPCGSCNGFGFSSARGTAYKTRAACDAGKVKGSASKCWSHDEHFGWNVRGYVRQACYSCSGVGDVPVYDPGEILPETWGRCDHMTPAVSAIFAERVQIVVQRGHNLTWGESFLGLGSLWATTDYGTADSMSDAEIIAMVRDKVVTDHTQWIKVIDADTRRMASHLVVNVGRNGYTVSAADVTQRMPLLPPTYTDAVLNRSV